MLRGYLRFARLDSVPHGMLPTGGVNIQTDTGRHFKRMWLVCLLLLAVRAETELREVWCPDDATVCPFTLVVDYGLTMMAGKVLVKAKQGALYRYDADPNNVTNQIPKHEAITADGFSEPRLVMTFNGTIPGPALHVRRGQTVRLTTINQMLHETTTVHIHGQYQRHSQYSDGVPFVTQCPILPGQTFVQTFKADPAGTFFYHAHSGPQLSNGLYGPFIVHPSLQDVPASQNGSQTPQEYILVLQDWNHDWDSNMITMKMRMGLYSHGSKFNTSSTLAGIHYSAFHFQSGLINGRGRFYDSTGQHNQAPLSEFLVTSGGQYRFRLINAGDILPFRVSIDSHVLQVVATDGHEIQPVPVESLIIHPGERYDVLVSANQSVGNYWIRAVTLEVGLNNTSEAILRYKGAPANAEPHSSAKTCTQDDPCLVLNCPFSFFPLGSHTYCYNYGQIKSLIPHVLKPAPGRKITEFFMNFAFPGTTETPGSVNGRAFVNQPFAALSKSQEVKLTCSRDLCGDDKVCHCPYAISYDAGDLIQLVFLNMGSGQGWDHPVHMHGHSFQVVKVGYPNYNSSGQFISANADIACRTPFCNSAGWANSSWSGGNLPDADTELGPLKDDIVVPSGGYVAVRFEADNPGLWIIHCHIELHMTDGMAALLNESNPLWPPPPPGFPICNNFYG